MSGKDVVKLVEDFVSLTGVQKALRQKLATKLTSEVLLESARIHKQMWGVCYHMSQQPIDAVGKVLVDHKVELEKIFAKSADTGRRHSRTADKTKTKTKTNTKTQSTTLSTILS